MQIITKSGNKIVLDFAKKEVTLPNGTVRKLEMINANKVYFENGAADISESDYKAARTAMYGGQVKSNDSKARHYDNVMNEGGEGFNPYRNNFSIPANIECAD